MTQDLLFPDASAEEPPYEEAVRTLRDHLLGAVNVDRIIRLAGQNFVIAWADRRAAPGRPVHLSVSHGMRVVEASGPLPPEVVASGEVQIALVIDGERLVFHLVRRKEAELTAIPDGDALNA